MQKPRIFYVSNHNVPGERANVIQILHTCEALANQNCEVDLFVRSGRFFLDERMETEIIETGLWEFFGLEHNFRLHYVPVINLRSPKKILREIHDKSFYLTSLVFILLYMLLVGKPKAIYTRNLALASFFTRIKHFIHVAVLYEAHDILAFLPNMSNSALRREKHVLRNADGIVVLTNAMKNILRNLQIPAEKVCVARDGADPRNYVLKKGSHRKSETDTRIVLYVGQLYKWKGIECLLEAFKEVKRKMSRVRLLVVGGLSRDYLKDLTRIRKRIKELGFSEDEVKVTGYMPYYQIGKIILSADVGVLPLVKNIKNEYFTSPLKLFEYMLGGLPVVATRSQAIEEVVHDEINGLLVPPGDPRNMGEAITKILKNEFLARRLARQARIDAGMNYTWNERARRIKELILASTCK